MLYPKTAISTLLSSGLFVERFRYLLAHDVSTFSERISDLFISHTTTNFGLNAKSGLIVLGKESIIKENDCELKS